MAAGAALHTTVVRIQTASSIGSEDFHPPWDVSMGLLTCAGARPSLNGPATVSDATGELGREI